MHLTYYKNAEHSTNITEKSTENAFSVIKDAELETLFNYKKSIEILKWRKMNGGINDVLMSMQDTFDSPEKVLIKLCNLWLRINL